MATGQSSRQRTSGANAAEDGAIDPTLPQKKRARHRLIGALVVSLVAAIVLPLVFESEPPRPPSDVAIVIPSRDMPLPARAGDTRATEPKGSEPKGPDPKPGDSKATESRVVEAKTAENRPADAKAADAKAGTDPRREPRVEGRIEPRPEAPRKEPRGDEIQQLADAAQARAKAPAGTAAVPVTQRYLLQVGAFASEAGAQQVVDKVQASGLKAYTEPVKTDRGQRMRVRVGPFASREAAEQARERLKQAGIESALIAP